MTVSNSMNKPDTQQLMSKTLTRFGETFVSYGSYHNNPVNQWIHIVCVPIIACTLIAALSYIPLHVDILGHKIGMDAVGVLMMSLFYLRINLVFGIAITVMFGVLTVAWKWMFAELSTKESFLKWVLIVHAVAWILQFVGHGVFQKRKPALMDNLAQTLSAPLFVLVEIAMKLGYKTAETDYWMELVQKRVAQFREKNKAK